MLLFLGVSVALASAASEQELVAPCGSALEPKDLDGVIGPEWDDAARHELRMGRYNAVICLKHGEAQFYIAMIVYTQREFPRGFEAYAVFDNGDGLDFSKGDDMLLVRAEDGALREADYYYAATYNFQPDQAGGGQINAYGAGRFDRAGGCYVFEMMRDIASGDTRDVPLSDEKTVISVYGWASY